jgi:hypothetical protein
VQTITASLDVGLGRVSADNQNIRRAVGKARADLADVGQDSSGTQEGSAP